MGEYKVSIITPFHNTDISMFKKCFQGMKTQSIGFDNIQWIIIFHNCEKDYITKAENIVKEYDNVYLKVLNNKSTGASSPRNYGFQFVEAPYMGFIDADDSYTPTCIETCLEVLKRNKAQIVSFRLEFERQNDKVKIIASEQGLWNPLDEEVVLTHSQIGDPRLTSSFIMSSQAKFYETDFLIKNDLKFDENMKMNETAKFVIACYIKADKIVSLPRFIGYHYFVNEGSTIQTASRDRSEIINFAEGHKRMFDQIYNGGLYYNHNYVYHLRLWIHYMLACKNFTKEDWKYCKDLLMPYVDRIEIPPTNKLYSKKEAEDIYKRIKTVFNSSFEELKAQNSIDIKSQETLLKIISHNLDSDYARYYNFSDIKSVKEYQAKAPIINEEKYQELVKIQTNVGEENVLSERLPQNYLYTFDSKDHLSILPISERDSRYMTKEFMFYIEDNVNLLLIESLPNNRLLSDNVLANSLDGMLLNNTIGKYSLSTGDSNFSFTSPYSLIFPKVAADTEYLNILFAVRNKEVTQIVSSDPWKIFNYVNTIKKNINTIINDIENGTITMNQEIPEDINKSLHELRNANKDRADELKKIDFNNLKLKDIWPKLKRIITTVDSNFSIYLKKLESNLEGLEVINRGSMEVFGYIGYPTIEKEVFRLNVSESFIEFKSLDQKDNSIKTFSEVEDNKIYELIITNNSGLYRYESNYFIQVVKNDNENIYYKKADGALLIQDKVISSSDIYNILNEVLGDRLFDFAYGLDDKLYIDIETEDDTLSVDERKAILSKLTVDTEIYLIAKETQLFRREKLRIKYNCPIDSIKPLRNIRSSEVAKQYKFSRIN